MIGQMPWTKWFQPFWFVWTVRNKTSGWLTSRRVHNTTPFRAKPVTAGLVTVYTSHGYCGNEKINFFCKKKQECDAFSYDFTSRTGNPGIFARYHQPGREPRQFALNGSLIKRRNTQAVYYYHPVILETRGQTFKTRSINLNNRLTDFACAKPAIGGRAHRARSIIKTIFLCVFLVFFKIHSQLHHTLASIYGPNL